MPEWVIQIIISLVGAVITLVGVIAYLSKNKTMLPNGNGGVKRSEISSLHEKINDHCADQNDHCAKQLEKCNEKFTLILTNQARQETILLNIANTVNSNKFRKQAYMPDPDD